MCQNLFSTTGWVFTINNYDEVDMIALDALAGLQSRSVQDGAGAGLVYLIFAFECGKRGTWHIQGYCFFRNVIRRKQMSRYLQSAYLAPANGTSEQNYEYVIKDGNFWEWVRFLLRGDSLGIRLGELALAQSNLPVRDLRKFIDASINFLGDPQRVSPRRYSNGGQGKGMPHSSN